MTRPYIRHSLLNIRSECSNTGLLDRLMSLEQAQCFTNDLTRRPIEARCHVRSNSRFKLCGQRYVERHIDFLSGKVCHIMPFIGRIQSQY